MNHRKWNSRPTSPAYEQCGLPKKRQHHAQPALVLVQMALLQHAAAAQLCEAALVENPDDWAAWQMLMDCLLHPGSDLQASGQLMLQVIFA